MMFIKWLYYRQYLKGWELVMEVSKLKICKTVAIHSENRTRKKGGLEY